MMYSFFYFSKLGSWRLGFWTEREGWGPYRHATELAVFIYTSRYREDLKIPKEAFESQPSLVRLQAKEPMGIKNK